MNSFVSTADFEIKPYDIPALTNPQAGLSSQFTAFIAREQELLLKKILGLKLYKEFEAGLDEVTPADKWKNLRDGAEYECDGKLYEWVGFQKALVPYIYARWLRETYDSVNGNGVTVAKVENAEVISPSLRITKAWNEFDSYIGSCSRKENTLYGFLDANESDYRSLDFCPVGRMNILDL